MGAILRAEPGAGCVPRLRASHRPQNFRPGHLARLRQLHGQPNLLYHLQQGLPAGVQKGAALQVSESGMATG